MPANDKFDKPHAVAGRAHEVNPQDVMPQPRLSTPGVTSRPGPGSTKGITTRAKGPSSFNRASGFRGKTAQNHSSGTTTDATKSANGKTSFKRA